MPALKKDRIAAPPRMNTDAGLIKDTSRLNSEANTARLNTDLRSFMDQGDAAFRMDKERMDVIEGVRKTILIRMREENRASLDDARNMELEHKRYSVLEVLPAIDEAKESERNAKNAYAEYLVAKSRLGNDNAAQARAQIDRLLQSAVTNKADADQRLLRQGQRRAPAAPAVPAVPAVPAAPAAPPAPPPPPVLPAGVAAAPAPAVGPNPGAVPAVGPNPGAVPAAGPNPGVVPAAAPNPAPAARALAMLSGLLETESQGSIDRRREDIDRLTELSGQITNPQRGFFSSLFSSDEKKEREAWNKSEKARSEAEGKKQMVLAVANHWDQIRKEYREKTFRKHYDSYDKHARAYYRFTRELEGRRQARAIGEVPADAGGGNASKNIAEYIGIYDMIQLNAILLRIGRNPYSETPALRRINGKDPGADSLNSVSSGQPFKYHKTIVMYAFGNGTDNATDEQEAAALRVRMKFTSDFRGYRAKNQFADDTYTAMTDRKESAMTRGKTFTGPASGDVSNIDRLAGTDADLLNLVDEERGRNGAYITSERSAKIYEFRTKDGRIVKGFSEDGEFYPMDNTPVEDIPSFNWQWASNEENLRRAIRRSDFFNHINAGTIQYYMSYNADKIFGASESDQKLSAPAPQQDPVSLFYQMIRDYQNSVLTMDLFGTTAQELKDFIPRLKGLDREKVRHLGVIMLSEDDPVLWGIARELAMTMTGNYGWGTLAERVKTIPASGQAMRIALLEEFSKDRSVDLTVKAFFKTMSDPMAAIRPDVLSMYMEDLSARRDSFFSKTSLKQGIMDGSILRTVTGSFSSAAADLDALTKTGAFSASGAEAARREYAANWAKLAAEAESIPGLILPVIPFPFFDRTNSDGVPTDTTSVPVIGTIQQAYSAVRNLASFINQIIERLDRDKDDPNRPAIMDILCTAADLCMNILNAVGWWVESDVMKAISGLSGSVKNLLYMIRDVLALAVAGIRRYGITSSNETLRTAYTRYREELLLAGGQNQGRVLTEADFATIQAKLGFAAVRNTQAERFLELSHDRAERDQIVAGTDLAANSIDAIGNFTSGGSKLAWFNPVSFPFKLAARVTNFLGWIGKKGFDDAHSFYNNITAALGDPRFAELHSFDEVLKRETGIENKSYLVDLARIFTAIDTHHLVHEPNKSPGDTALAVTAMQPFIKLVGDGDMKYKKPSNRQANEALLQNVRLDQLLKAVGAPGNWQALLRASITGR